jgi:hypothetical protein
MGENEGNVIDEMARKRMTRRRALSSAGKLGVAVAATAVIAGAGGYGAGYYTAPSGSGTTKTVTGAGSTATATTTVTVTTGGSGTTTSGGSTTSSGGTTTSSSAQYTAAAAAWIGIWPLDFTPPHPVANLSGTCRATQFDTIKFQSDPTIPGTRAACAFAALENTYPNVKWSNYDTGPNGNPTLTALQAGQNNWDVTRGNAGPSFVSLGYVEPITDFFNAWPEKNQYTAQQMSVGQAGNDFYLLPDCADVHAGWWRKDLFAEAGFGSFDYSTFEYTGTTPNQMTYQELGTAVAAITKAGASASVYGSYIPNGGPAILGPWYVDHFLRGNGGLKYWGDINSCTVTMDKAPYYNNNLDSLNFLQSNLSNYTPGGATLDLNALLTEIISGSLGYFFGPDPNLDLPMSQTAMSKSNPKAPAGVSVRNGIQPTTGWADGKPLDPNLPPSWAVSSYDAILRGATTPAAAWEWIRVYSGYAAWLLLLGNASGLPSRLDVSKVAAADSNLDVSDWIAAYTGWTWADLPFISSFGPVLGTSYQNTIDPFVAGTGTAESCVTNYVQATTSALQKAGVPAFSGTIPT